MSKTYWGCEHCGKHGAVEHDEHADVWHVYTLVIDEHHREAAGMCIDVDRIRVSKEPFPLVTVDAWNPADHGGYDIIYRR